METDDFDTRLPAYRQAVYKPDSNLQLAGNQMAEVWPGPLMDTYASLRARFPARKSGYFDQPLEARLEDLERLDGFHYPFEGEEQLVRRVITLVRTSFIARNPSNPVFMKALMAASAGDLKSVPRLSETGGGGKLGFLIIGPTGCGKSSFADRLMRLFGTQPWLHVQLRQRPCQWFQLGAIRVKAKRSLRSTLEVGVQCIDAQLRTDFYSRRGPTASATRYESSLTAGLTAHAAPYILIDDVERLLSIRGGEAEAILNTFVDIMEYAGIPVILVGTIRAYRMFERFPTIMHKFSSGGVARFGPVPNGRDFTNYVRAMLKQNVSEHSLNEADDLVDQIWLHTCGVRRVTREVVRCLLLRHAHEPGIKLNAGLLAEIFDDELSEYRGSLQVMRQVALGIDPGFLNHQRYEDFVPQQAPKMTTEALDVIRKFRAERGIAPTGLSEHLTPEVFADLRAQQIAAEEDVGTERRVASEETIRKKAAKSSAGERDEAASLGFEVTKPTQHSASSASTQGSKVAAGKSSSSGEPKQNVEDKASPSKVPSKKQRAQTFAHVVVPQRKEAVIEFTPLQGARTKPVDPGSLR